eukprot:TRINITY_DN68137_c0_g1_i1.p1 TRINITY_DN68137_c0_g1~~TRINITY_DN68137_c0_g1_i1.p1  ORF type:complete len:303 (-),score=40.55 TRINITY_DN68137_c0_g1_i1:13-921(-)
MQVSVISCASGEIIWGPRPVRRAERVGWVRKRFAISFECDVDSVRLLHGARQLDDEETLQSIVTGEDNELLLTLMRGGDGAGAAEVLARLQKTGADRFAQGRGGILVSDDPAGAIPEEEIMVSFAEIARVCDAEELPPELANWLHALMTGGKCLRIARDDGFGLYTCDWGGPFVGAEAKHQPGLFCLSARWHNDQAHKNFIVYFLDLTGALCEIYGAAQSESNSATSVWCAHWANSAWSDLDQELHVAFGPSLVPTLDMLRQMKNGELPIPGDAGMGHDMMRCVAPSLSQLFRELSYSGALQ